MEAAKFYRLFYPQVPAILAASHGSTVSAMPVVSFTMLSESPPVVGVSSANSHRTLKTVLRSRSFSMSWVGKEMAAAVERLALPTKGRPHDKLSSAGLAHHRGKSLPVPVPNKAVAVIECRLAAKRNFGDHTLLIGRVEVAYASEDFEGYWQFEKYRPILYTGWRGGLSVYD